MNEITPEESDAIIDAASRGEHMAGHGELGEMLTGLHASDGAGASTAPLMRVRHGSVGRVARRTAVAATAAVLGVAGVAAAESFVAPDAPAPAVESVELIEVEEEPFEIVLGDPGVEDAPEVVDDAEAKPEVETESDDAPKGPAVEIEGVDTSDGVDDDELEIACDAVGNHGEYVRLVARDKVTEHDGSHGDRVSEAAQTECGKSSDADDEDGVDEDEVDDDEDGVDDEADESDDDDETVDDDRPGNGNGNGHDRGNGNGHDKDKNNGNGHNRD